MILIASLSALMKDATRATLCEMSMTWANKVPLRNGLQVAVTVRAFVEIKCEG